MSSPNKLVELVSGKSNTKGDGILENKAFTVKSVDAKNHRISAIASMNTKDRDGDIILPSAFKKSLPGYMKNPVILACHKHSLADGRSPVVGIVVEARIDDKALHVVIEFEHETELGKEYWTLYSKKRMRALSVGFMPMKWKDTRDDKGKCTLRVYTEVELLEISCVPVPSNREALSKSAKKKADWLSGKAHERELEFDELDPDKYMRQLMAEASIAESNGPEANISDEEYIMTYCFGTVGENPLSGLAGTNAVELCKLADKETDETQKRLLNEAIVNRCGQIIQYENLGFSLDKFDRDEYLLSKKIQEKIQRKVEEVEKSINVNALADLIPG